MSGAPGRAALASRPAYIEPSSAHLSLISSWQGRSARPSRFPREAAAVGATPARTPVRDAVISLWGVGRNGCVDPITGARRCATPCSRLHSPAPRRTGREILTGPEGVHRRVDRTASIAARPGSNVMGYVGRSRSDGAGSQWGATPATVPLSGSGTISPGIYSIGGILRAGTGSITPDARSGTAQFTYQLTLRP